jgi:ribose transport system permease protein
LELLAREPVIVLAVFLTVLMSFLNPYFLTTRNLLNVLRASSIIGIVTCGVSWMLISGSFDLSVGSIVSLCSVIMMTQLNAGADPVRVVITGLAAGLVLGLVNGLLIAWLRANPMIITLGTMTIYQGLAFMISGGRYFMIPEGSPFLKIGNAYVGPMAVPSLIFLSLAFIMHVTLSETAFGRRVYAMGGNERAARLVGLKVTRYRTLMYLVTGLTSAISAMVVSARARGGNAYFFGQGFEFDAITAAVFGGVYLFGGRGSVFRGVLGATLLALLANAQTIMGVSVRMQMVVQGIVLVAMVGIQVWAAKRAG